MPILTLIYIITIIAISASLMAIIEGGYIYCAKKLGIFATDANHTVTGGGIIFPLAYFVSDLIFTDQGFLYPYFLVGTAIIAIISFIDDIRGLSPILRLIVHFICVALMIGQAEMSMATDIPFWVCSIIAVTSVAIINAFNFLDGIRGITGCYSLTVLLTAYSQFSESALFMLIGAVIAFCCFNFRTPERCFAGDTGSICMGYITSFALLLCALRNHGDISSIGIDWTVIIYVSVYLADFGITLLRRIFKHENILSPHRNHIYQRLAYNCHISHIKIAASYAILQLAISITYSYASSFRVTFFIATSALLSILYYIIYRKSGA